MKPTFWIAIVVVLLCTAAFVQATPQANDTPTIVLKADFEAAGVENIVAPEQAASAILTADTGEVVTGKRSLKGDSQAAGMEWNEFFHSRTGFFRAKEAYRVAFDYKILARTEGTKFYALFRRKGANNAEGWHDWQGKPGDTGHVELTLATRNADDYFLIVGIQNRGALAIDNLTIETDPDNRPPDAALPAPTRTWKSPGHTAYYVDSTAGDDSRDGRSAANAWRTLVKVNAGEFARGDKILLKSGGAWTGYLAPGGGGSAGAPVVIDKYGKGAKPKIDGEGKTLVTFVLSNMEQWEVGNLDIANKGRIRQPNLAGVQVRLEDFGVAHHIHLKNLDIHDVTGSLVKSEGGGAGISFSNGGSKMKSRFDDLLVENCHLVRTDRNGIGMSGYWARQDWFPSLHVVIRGNLLEDIGGDGIVPVACDGAVIERNIIHGCRTRCDDSAAGIWPWSCDNTVVQFNEVSGMKGTRDGKGYDSDWNCQHTLFQYNYSHDNEGGFMLICNDGSVKAPWNVGNIGTIIRYNISQNDGERIFQITGPCRDTLIYNNTIYIGPKLNVYLVQGGNWGGDWSENTRFANNMFYVDGKAHSDFGGLRKTVFENNVFHSSGQGSLDERPEYAALPIHSKLVAPGTGSAGFDSLRGYSPLSGSPLHSAGKTIPDNGGRDFRGRPVPRKNPPTIGAVQH